MKKDYLKGTDFVFYQDDELYKFNTDTYLLGTFLDFHKGKSVMDIGTNTGALLLYASLRHPKELIGVDINEKALKIARHNLEANGVKATLINSMIQELKHDQVDIIVCNPPFFKERDHRDNENYNLAMFEDSLPLDELFASFRRLLKDNGKVYLNYPSFRINELFKECERQRFRIEKLTYVFEKEKKESFRSLLILKKGIMRQVRVSKPLLLENGAVKDLI